MKCALVVPSWLHDDTHMDALVSTIAGLWAPTGILYLAGALVKAEHEVVILDGAVLTTTQIIQRLKLESPEFIGLSSVYALWNKTINLAKQIRNIFPNVFIAAGGSAPTYFKEKSFEMAPQLDAVLLGEGEDSICELVNKLEKKQNYTDVACGLFKCADKIICNDGYGIVKDLNELPMPAYELVDIKDYRPSIGLFKRLPVISTFSSRGCPNKCIYCSKIAGSTIRYKTPENIGNELETYVSKLGVKEVKFFDDLFTHDKDRAIKICHEIKKRKLGIVWSASSRVDTIDEELIKEMRDAGCWYIHYGIESGVQKNLDTLKKNTTLKQIEETVTLTHKLKVNTFTSYILGIPGETYEEALKTIQFACKLNSLFSEFFYCTPFPGTEIYEKIEKYGTMTKITDKVGMHLNSFTPYTLTEKQLQSLRRKAFLKFYLRGTSIVKQIKSIESPSDIPYKLLGLKAIGKLILRG